MSFEPKHKVNLDPPKDDIISIDYLSKCDGASLPVVDEEAALTCERHERGLPNLRSDQGTMMLLSFHAINAESC